MAQCLQQSHVLLQQGCGQGGQRGAFGAWREVSFPVPNLNPDTFPQQTEALNSEP